MTIETKWRWQTDDEVLFNPAMLGPQNYRDKPKGVWFTPTPKDWSDFVTQQDLDWLEGQQLIEFRADMSDVLVLASVGELRAFAAEYQSTGICVGIDWPAVCAQFSGIEITPYQWDCRLELNWYYGWDLASGCFWKDIIK